MYGTVAKMKAKPGVRDAFIRDMQRDATQVPGAIAINVYQMDNNPDEFYVVVAFKDKQSYRANAERPETHANYLKMMESLVVEPEWHDGEIVYSEMYASERER
jgi:quinol monooxygenase YgiN